MSICRFVAQSLRASVMTSLNATLTKAGLKWVCTGGGGDCLFNSVSIGIHGTESRRDALRRRAVAYIRAHPTDPAFGNAPWEYNDIGIFTLGDYCDMMERQGVWGDEHAIVALTKSTQRPIVVISTVDTFNYIAYGTEFEVVNSPVYVHFEKSHYSAVVPIHPAPPVSTPVHTRPALVNHRRSKRLQPYLTPMPTTAAPATATTAATIATTRATTFASVVPPPLSPGHVVDTRPARKTPAYGVTILAPAKRTERVAPAPTAAAVGERRSTRLRHILAPLDSVATGGGGGGSIVSHSHSHATPAVGERRSKRLQNTLTPLGSTAKKSSRRTYTRLQLVIR
jgi:hypothetical protein